MSVATLENVKKVVFDPPAESETSGDARAAEEPSFYQFRTERQPQGWITPERDIRITSLALRYRSGDKEALGDLYAELLPQIKNALRPYFTGIRDLPKHMELTDLYQQAYVELAEMVLDWNPERSFSAFFLGAFRWRIHNFMRQQIPSMRTDRFEMVSMSHNLMIQTIAAQAGTDGRDWDDDVAAQEMLDQLTPRQREVVEMHVFEGLSLPEIGRRLGFGQSAAYDFFYRAMKRLKKLLDASAAVPFLQAA